MDDIDRALIAHFELAAAGRPDLSPVVIDKHFYVDADGNFTDEQHEEMVDRLDRGQWIMIHSHDVPVAEADAWDLCDNKCSVMVKQPNVG